MAERHPQTQFSVQELAERSGFSVRTIRYYVQQELLERPIGETRAAYYTQQHLQALAEIKRLSESGVSLEGIRAVLHGAASPTHLPVARKPGSVLMCSHIVIAPGVHLVIDPDQSTLK